MRGDSSAVSVAARLAAAERFDLRGFAGWPRLLSFSVVQCWLSDWQHALYPLCIALVVCACSHLIGLVCAIMEELCTSNVVGRTMASNLLATLYTTCL